MRIFLYILPAPVAIDQMLRNMFRRLQRIVLFTKTVPSNDIFYVTRFSDVSNCSFSNMPFLTYRVLFVIVTVGRRYAWACASMRLSWRLWNWEFVCHAVNWHVLLFALITNRFCVSLDAYYFVRPAGARSKFVAGVLCHGLRWNAGYCSWGRTIQEYIWSD